MEIQPREGRLGRGLEPVLARVVRALCLYDVEGVGVARLLAGVPLRFVVNLGISECFLKRMRYF